MRVPTRRSELLKKTEPPDRFVTKTAFESMKKTLERLEKIERPAALEEVRRTAEMGDLSENFGHYVAKTTLRSLDSRIASLKDKINGARIIDEGGSADGRIHIGSTVTLESEGQIVKYQILGSTESDPLHGTISHRSPLGQELLGAKLGDVITVKTPAGERTYTITKT